MMKCENKAMNEKTENKDTRDQETREEDLVQFLSGKITIAEIARRWGISYSRARNLCNKLRNEINQFTKGTQ